LSSRPSGFSPSGGICGAHAWDTGIDNETADPSTRARPTRKKGGSAKPGGRIAQDDSTVGRMNAVLRSILEHAAEQKIPRNNVVVDVDALSLI